MKSPNEAIADLEVTAAPGETEAAAIRADYKITLTGLHAFVRMGFRLMDVKARLPHGQYMAWCGKHLAGLSPRHLHRAKSIADHFANETQCVRFEDLDTEALAMIDAAAESGGVRALLSELQEFAEPEGSELKAKEECEKRWTRKPEERDDWEPRVLSGEISYLRALQGMLGSQLTKGKTKEPVRPHEILMSAAGKMARHFASFEGLPPLAQASVLEEIREMAEVIPAACRAAMLEVWEGGDA